MMEGKMGEVVWGPGAKGVVTVDYVDGDTIGVRGWGCLLYTSDAADE